MNEDAGKLKQRVYHREKRRIIRKSIDESYQSWRNTTLFTETESRKLGFDWITKQMFNNTDRVFMDCDFPSPGDLMNFEDFTIRETIDDSFQYIWRHQVILPITMQQAVAAMRMMVLNFAKGAIWSPGNGILMDEELLEDVGREIVYSRTQVNELEAVNLLCREFSPSDKKCVFVSQNILDDEALPFIQRQCNRRFWIMLHSIHKNTTVCQTLYANSQFFTKEGFVSIEEEAACWGYPDFPADLSLHDQEITFKRHANFVGTNFLSYNNQTFHATNAKLSE
ncbi:hypothetical protein THRCLA_07420 [Thraustotheca clavata]|uniref:Uncharacterized protein n=1 Tax=Thraustotheca clavata TaxID=74557 RepID=A0A1V9ZDB8_9STRA|nr:hypothetical protein THRCLA_07420 [Thraustotheca clavata]